jgi:lipopolysaccharide transport system permease protein
VIKLAPVLGKSKIVSITFQLIHQWFLTPITHKRLVKNFTRQDFTAQFTASIGGFIWLLLTPICNITIYAFVFSYIFKVRAVEDFGETSFVLFLMIGYLPWFAFAESLGKSTSLLLDKASLITKVKFPVQILPVSGTLVPYLTHTIGLVLLLIYLAANGYANAMWAAIPLVLFLQFIFTMGLVAILSSLSVFLRDLQQIVALIVSIWFFLTPIIYPINMIQSDTIRSYFLWNPMHSFINLYREIILLGEISFNHLQISIIFAIASYILGGWLFMKIRPAFGDVL